MSELVIQEKPKTSLIQRIAEQRRNEIAINLGGSVVRIPRQDIMLDDKRYSTDPNELISMIKQITQMVGDYRKENTIFGAFMIHGLRKVRASMVATLQQHFKISWSIDKATGESVFSM